MAVGDLYWVRDKYTFLSEEMMNVYLYSHTDGEGDAQDLADDWEEMILPLILEIQHANAIHSEIEVVNIDDPEDFHTQVLVTGNAGLLTGDTLPKYNAWGFRKNRSSTAHRNGAIRIGGVAEVSQDGGNATSGALEDLGTLAAQLGVRLTGSSGNSYDLYIAGKPLTSGGPPVPKGISTVQYVRLTTQNSRKR